MLNFAPFRQLYLDHYPCPAPVCLPSALACACVLRIKYWFWPFNSSWHIDLVIAELKPPAAKASEPTVERYLQQFLFVTYFLFKYVVPFASLNQVYFASQTTESRSHDFLKYLSRKGHDFIAQYKHTYCSEARFLYNREVWFPLDQNLGSDGNAIEESFRIQPCFDLMQRD